VGINQCYGTTTPRSESWPMYSNIPVDANKSYILQYEGELSSQEDYQT
jgi:hypothetical protein